MTLLVFSGGELAFVALVTLISGWFVGVLMQAGATRKACADAEQWRNEYQRANVLADERGRALDAYCGSDLQRELRRAEPALRAMLDAEPAREPVERA
jgi:hypothetical protein